MAAFLAWRDGGGTNGLSSYTDNDTGRANNGSNTLPNTQCGPWRHVATVAPPAHLLEGGSSTPATVARGHMGEAAMDRELQDKKGHLIKYLGAEAMPVDATPHSPRRPSLCQCLAGVTLIVFPFVSAGWHLILLVLPADVAFQFAVLVLKFPPLGLSNRSITQVPCASASGSAANMFTCARFAMYGRWFVSVSVSTLAASHALLACLSVCPLDRLPARWTTRLPTRPTARSTACPPPRPLAFPLARLPARSPAFSPVGLLARPLRSARQRPTRPHPLHLSFSVDSRASQTACVGRKVVGAGGVPFFVQPDPTRVHAVRPCSISSLTAQIVNAKIRSRPLSAWSCNGSSGGGLGERRLEQRQRLIRERRQVAGAAAATDMGAVAAGYGSGSSRLRERWLEWRWEQRQRRE
ncbi:hypothetical protein GGX14DRAFT_600938 [Mycena pura]|uniref:Uncharacterized protein n=1 Tax=Mycena pura TaxID=153505 RepID=A0AAD6Y0P2_9AGAR|nr:hypothetical protein GGX14DRAFT_600938 [Mycena pura]